MSKQTLKKKGEAYANIFHPSSKTEQWYDAIIRVAAYNGFIAGAKRKKVKQNKK